MFPFWAEKRLKKATRLGQLFKYQGLLNDFFSDAEKPIHGIKPEKMGEMREAEFAASLSNPPFKPLPRKQPDLQDFSKNVQDFDYKCF